jgi:hypothetical protein
MIVVLRGMRGWGNLLLWDGDKACMSITDSRSCQCTSIDGNRSYLDIVWATFPVWIHMRL